jgi:hypothetical protein
MFDIRIPIILKLFFLKEECTGKHVQRCSKVTGKIKACYPELSQTMITDVVRVVVILTNVFGPIIKLSWMLSLDYLFSCFCVKIRSFSFSLDA